MGIPTLANETPLSLIKEEDNHTRSRLEANPLTVALAVPFVGFLTNTFGPVSAKEQALVYALELASAKVFYSDTVLNGLVNKVDGALLMLCNKDRKSPLYQRFFGEQRPFEVAAGILGPQLETMRGWIPDLLASPHAILKAIGGEIEAAVAAADAAVAEKQAVMNQISTFETMGERAQAVSAYNALRKETYGALGKLRHEHPELTKEFPDMFFRHETNRGLARLSPEELQLKMDALDAEKAGLARRKQAALDKLKADADDKERADRLKKEAAIEIKRREIQSMESALAKMVAELPS